MKILSFVLILSAAITTHAQDLAKDQVPPVVLNAFQAKFTDVKDVEWKLKEDQYKVEFKVGKRNHEVWIDKNGSILKHKEDFPKSSLPKEILLKLENEFKAYRIDDADKIEIGGNILYQVDLDGSNEDRKVLFSADGTIKENKID